MDSTVISIIVGMAGVIAGIIAGKFIFAKDTKKQIEDAEQQAQRIITDAQLQAETLKKEKILEAKEKFVQLKSDHDKEVFDRNRKISDLENRAKQKELSLNQKEVNLDKQLKDNEAIKENLNRQLEVVAQKQQEFDKHQEEQQRIVPHDEPFRRGEPCLMVHGVGQHRAHLLPLSATEPRATGR